MAIKFDYNTSTLSKGIDNMTKKVGAAVLMYCDTKAKELQSTMKKNRPWTDRTGMAKAMLDAKTSQPKFDTVRITLIHGVDYGIWLELANEKNYAIILPTINQEAPKLITGLKGILGTLKL